MLFFYGLKSHGDFFFHATLVNFAVLKILLQMCIYIFCNLLLGDNLCEVCTSVLDPVRDAVDVLTGGRVNPG